MFLLRIVFKFMAKSSSRRSFCGIIQASALGAALEDHTHMLSCLPGTLGHLNTGEE